MRLSLLQPEIVRGDIEHNLGVIQRLVDEAEGDLLVLPEYGLTGSLVLDREADVRDWAVGSARAKAQIAVPEGKYLLINALVLIDDRLYNCCDLMPTDERRCKLFPDETEVGSGILPGTEQRVFELLGQRFKVIICTDLQHMDRIPTDGLDFVVWVFHFGVGYRDRAMADAQRVSQERGLRMFVSSLVSDQNVGFSSYLDGGDVVVSLGRQEGILEVSIS